MVCEAKLFISSSNVLTLLSKYCSLSEVISNSKDLIISSISIDGVIIGSGESNHVKPIL